MSYKLKLNEKCENAVVEYLRACVQISSALMGQVSCQCLANRQEWYRLDSDDLGLIALYKLMNITVAPLVPNKKGVVQLIKLHSLSIFEKQKHEFFQLYSTLKQTFSEECLIEPFIETSRIIILDSRMSLQVKAYALNWLQDYSHFKNKVVRQYFERDIKLL